VSTTITRSPSFTDLQLKRPSRARGQYRVLTDRPSCLGRSSDTYSVGTESHTAFLVIKTHPADLFVMVNTSRDVSIVTGQNLSFYDRQDSSPRTIASSFTCITKSTSADKTDPGRIMRRPLSHQPPERTATILKGTNSGSRSRRTLHLALGMDDPDAIIAPGAFTDPQEMSLTRSALDDLCRLQGFEQSSADPPQ
jgi:hypothetical protein